MFSKVLFATDLSPASDRALECLASWKAWGLAEVTVSHVHAIRYGGGASGLEDQLRADHEPKLERQVKRLEAHGLEASWRFDFGVPYLELERIARERGADAVVIGSHGGSWIKEIWLGSVADAILRHVTLPVLVIKANLLAEIPLEQCTGFCNSIFGKVLLATDFSPATSGAVHLVHQLARRFAIEVRLVHVQEHSRIFPHLVSRLEEFNREDTHRLEALAEELRQLGASQVSYELRTDHPVRGLLASIAEWEPRLVIVGRYGRSGIMGRLIGSTSHAVARDSRAPVLVVPSKKA